MKKQVIWSAVFLCLGLYSFSQKIIYSDLNKKDNRNINFEIISKYDGNLLVYKNITRQHFITRYDKDLHIIDNIELDFIPEKTFNLDFIPYQDHFIVIYQLQKNNIVYCYGVKINSKAEKISEPIMLDTTNIGYFSDNKIYTTTYSEDKSKILIYKRNIKNDVITLATKLFDSDFNLSDSTREVFEYTRQREYYSDFSVDNSGNIAYVKLSNKRNVDNAEKGRIYIHYPKADTFSVHIMPLEYKFLEEVNIKMDNLNKNCIVNGFYYSSKKGNIEGLYTAVKSLTERNEIRSSFNDFDDLSDMSNAQGKKLNFENLTTQNIILKKNGGFVLLSEFYYTETLSSNNSWNRNYYNSFPYYPINGYYLYNPYYNNYRPWDNYNGNESTRYYYNDIVAMSVDSSLHKEWNQVIGKKQYDVDNDNFLSYSTMKSAGELKFLFIERDRQRNIISQPSITSVGEYKRNVTLKGGESNYEFMPRFAKQISFNQVVMPFVHLNQIGFARIDF